MEKLKVSKKNSAAAWESIARTDLFVVSLGSIAHSFRCEYSLEDVYYVLAVLLQDFPFLPPLLPFSMTHMLPVYSGNLAFFPSYVDPYISLLESSLLSSSLGLGKYSVAWCVFKGVGSELYLCPWVEMWLLINSRSIALPPLLRTSSNGQVSHWAGKGTQKTCVFRNLKKCKALLTWGWHSGVCHYYHPFKVCPLQWSFTPL